MIYIGSQQVRSSVDHLPNVFVWQHAKRIKQVGAKEPSRGTTLDSTPYAMKVARTV